jgi:hypothetical protein
MIVEKLAALAERVVKKILVITETLEIHVIDTVETETGKETGAAIETGTVIEIESDHVIVTDTIETEIGVGMMIGTGEIDETREVIVTETGIVKTEEKMRNVIVKVATSLEGMYLARKMTATKRTRIVSEVLQTAVRKL